MCENINVIVSIPLKDRQSKQDVHRLISEQSNMMISVGALGNCNEYIDRFLYFPKACRSRHTTIKHRAAEAVFLEVNVITLYMNWKFKSDSHYLIVN